jgi:hypothetical protein
MVRLRAVLIVVGVLAMSAVQAPSAGAATRHAAPRASSLCGDLKKYATSAGQTPTRTDWKKIDALYKRISRDAPRKIKKDIVKIRAELKAISNAKPGDVNSLRKYSARDFTKSATEFSKWVTPYLSKKCGVKAG